MDGLQADADSGGDASRRAPFRRHSHDPLSTQRCQPGILVHVHPVLLSGL
jgi:hypothetical protein